MQDVLSTAWSPRAPCHCIPVPPTSQCHPCPCATNIPVPPISQCHPYSCATHVPLPPISLCHPRPHATPIPVPPISLCHPHPSATPISVPPTSLCHLYSCATRVPLPPTSLCHPRPHTANTKHLGGRAARTPTPRRDPLTDSEEFVTLRLFRLTLCLPFRQQTMMNEPQRIEAAQLRLALLFFLKRWKKDPEGARNN